MRKLLAALSLGLVLAIAGQATAREGGEGGKKRKAERGEGKKRQKPERAQGTLEAASLKGGNIEWTVAVEDEDGGKASKTFQMSANVLVAYAERDGTNHARMIRAAGRKTPEGKGKTQFAQGTFVQAAVAGDAATLTIKVGDEEKPFQMGTAVKVAYRAAGDGTLTALIIGGGRPPRKAKGEGRGGKRGGKAKRGGDEAPDEM